MCEKKCENGREKGVTTILFVLLLPVIIGLVGLALDLSYMIYWKQKLQNTVDLSARVAVQETVKNHGQVESTAIEFTRKNGLNTSHLSVLHPYLEDPYKVEVTHNLSLRLPFLSVLGFGPVELSARAVAAVLFQTETVIQYQALDYAVFSASTAVDLQIKGNGSVINGNVHGNKKVALMGSHTINGNLEAVDGTSGDLSRISGNKVTKGAPVLPIPDFNFDDMAAQANQVFTGDQIFNNININGIWLIQGNVTLNGGRIQGRGIILATGSINLPSNNVQYSSSQDLLALYSLGDITLSCTRNQIHGILYAPNGRIKITGSYNTFYGALIAQEVYWATKDITINGDYDIRAPQAFTVTKPTFVLTE